jgi:mannan endo-1,4-beta-mannosidase
MSRSARQITSPLPSFRLARRARAMILASAILLLGASVQLGFAENEQMSTDGFVRSAGTGFVMDGRPFFVAGVNNHYLTFGSNEEVLRVLDDAAGLGANVVRTFIQPVIGALDGSVPTIWNWKQKADASDLGVNGTYMLYWNSSKGRMGVNDGPDGLQKVDFLIAEARKRNLKLIVAFLDFWNYTGGAQQMRAWYGSRNEETFFFADPRTKQDFRTWVRHVLERVNPLTGLAYRDDPPIFGWELMNEPNARPDRLRESWIAEMSSYVKSLDKKHLVSSGHANVDNRLSDLSIASIDFGTWHGYPLYYKLTPRQFNSLIVEFCTLAKKDEKPVLLEEFGYARSNRDQAKAYQEWLDTIHDDPECAGWVVWRLVSRQDSGRFPLDEYSQFDIRNDGSPIWHVLQAAAARLRAKSDAALRARE